MHPLKRPAQKFHPLRDLPPIPLLAVIAALIAVQEPSPASADQKVAAPQERVQVKDKDESAKAGDPAKESDEEFRHKLSQMLEREDKSLKLLREQITESQSAPFLPDLYLQLADLLSDRANTLYYIEQERFKGVDVDFSDKRFSPVISAEQEAIVVYKDVLRDFPRFDKRRHVLYRLTLALKSIDEPVPFMRYGGQLLREYPGSEEAVKVRLLIGQYYFEKKLMDESVQMLVPVARSKFPYERNLARYRLGLIALDQERFKDALQYLEQVVVDPELKETDNPYALSLKEKTVKSDLKREALLDSIRAYTMVHDKDPDPVGYYSRIAPTELHFQEVIEKLAVRYVNLKRYLIAVQLLRTLAERMADPQRVISIYKDVLLMIPVMDRTRIPVEEIRFLLNKYVLWRSYYQLSPALQAKSYAFFEKQIRSLGTVSHDAAKATRDPARKAAFLARARDFYLLYITTFDKGPMMAKMAINLADVYYLQGDYLNAGDIYLRSFNGEFGPARPRKVLIENAILCLQKRKNYSYYENVRVHGLLLKAIDTDRQFDPSTRNNPAMTLLYLKAEYEQGFFPETLDSLFAFLKSHRGTRQAVDAGELIMDYYNTRKDFAGLELWAERLMAVGLPDPAFNRKLAMIKRQARSGMLYEKVKATTGYDDFAQGKSYLTAALRAPDSGTQSAVLQEALDRSKHEGDVNTFFQAAAILAEKERDPRKRAAILSSVAREQAKLTQFYQALARFRGISENGSFRMASRVDALEDSVNVALLLRDWQELAQCARSPLWIRLSSATQTRVREQIGDLIDSPVRPPSELVDLYLRMGVRGDALVPLFRAQYRIPGNLRQTLYSRIASSCPIGSNETICLWGRLDPADRRERQFVSAAERGNTSMASIQPFASSFKGVADDYRPLETSNDSLLNATAALRLAGLFNAFGQYLNRAARANPDVSAVLVQKSRETLASAKAYQDNCAVIARKSPSAASIGRYCESAEQPELRDLLMASEFSPPGSSHRDPSSEAITLAEKGIFVSGPEKNGDALLKLSRKYFDSGNFRHAAASASYGMSMYKDSSADFQTLLGCSLAKLGLFGEANFRLKDSAPEDGLRERCLREISAFRSGR